MLKITVVARMSGPSIICTIPREIASNLHIQPGHRLLLDIYNTDDFVKNIENPIIKYRCLGCQHQFCSTDEIAYCPACDNQKLEIVYEDSFIQMKGGQINKMEESQEQLVETKAKEDEESAEELVDEVNKEESEEDSKDSDTPAE